MTFIHFCEERSNIFPFPTSTSKQVEGNNTKVPQVDEHEEDDETDQSLKFGFG